MVHLGRLEFLNQVVTLAWHHALDRLDLALAVALVGMQIRSYADLESSMDHPGHHVVDTFLLEVAIRVPMNVAEAGFRTVHVATWDCTQIEGPSAGHPAHTEVVGSVPGAAAVHSHDTHRGELHPLDRRLCGA